jgi:opacity protein-like surface antigen
MQKALTYVGGAFVATSLLIAPASAQENYVSASAGLSMLQDSDNSGEFSSDFTTGAGTTIPAGVVLPAGTEVGWTTEFERGYSVSAAYGRDYGAWRGEVEIALQSNDIDTHNGVQAAGIALANEDAGVLITGSSNLGVTVGALVDDGAGSVKSTFLMANAYYDFGGDSAFSPYIGAGVGVAKVEVEYAPSGVGIVDDSDTLIAYQLIGGASYDLSDAMAIFAQARYRATPDVETQVDLFDAKLDVENTSTLLEAGVRFRF